MIKFETTKYERSTITAILDRLVKESPPPSHIPRGDLDMALVACHCNGTPLDLEKLLKADLFTLTHDVYGIDRHISRTDGKLKNCFLPRCAK